jgi:hypothetical protein
MSCLAYVPCTALPRLAYLNCLPSLANLPSPALPSIEYLTCPALPRLA